MSGFNLDELMYLVSGLLLTPVLAIIAALFVYAFVALGAFVAQAAQRWTNRTRYRHALTAIKRGEAAQPVAGFPLVSAYAQDNRRTSIDLELIAIKRLETARVVTRVAPMLGLVATMVPMGPALKALAQGNVQGISDNLVIAFSAVIFGLVTASLTFVISAVSKRWLASELNDVGSRLAPVAGNG